MINGNKSSSYNVVQFKQKPKNAREEIDKAMGVELASLTLRGMTGNHALRYNEISELTFEDKEWLLKLMREQLL